MTMRIILINWKFIVNFEKIENPIEKKVHDESNGQVIGCNYNEKSVKSFIDLIKKTLKTNSNSSLLVLLHESNCITSDSLGIQDKKEEKIKIRVFGNGDGAIYFNSPVSQKKGLLGTSTFAVQALIDDQINNDHFQFVWNYYWNELDLVNQKKKLIETFLPIAIDLQGLSEMTEPQKRELYLIEVVADLEKNAKSIIKTWYEIKTILALNTKKGVTPLEHLYDKFKLNDKEKQSIYFPLENEQKPGFTKKALVSYFKSEKNWSGKTSFPNWLKNVVKILDDKIK